MFNKTLGLFLLVICLLPVVSAFDMQITTTYADSNSIYFDEAAQYNLTITNDELKEVVYSVDVNSVEWVLESMANFAVPANSTKTIPLLIRPKQTNFQGVGTHYVSVIVSSNTGHTQEEEILLYIKSFKQGYGDYLPTVSLSASMVAKVDPREEFIVEVLIKNRNILNMKDVELRFVSDDFDESRIIDLDGLSEKSLKYTLAMNEKAVPGSKKLRVTAVYKDKIISEAQDVFEVTPYAEIDRTTIDQNTWFKKTKITTLTNNGNIEKAVTTKLDSPWYVRLFSSMDVEAQVVEKSGSTSVVTLQPNESAKVVVVENYRYPLGILLAIAIGIILYFQLRCPIVMQKQIVITGRDEEGTSEMKVRIFVRNRTDKSYFNIRLIDKAPSIAHVLPSNSSVGVIQPNKIIPTDKKGTIIKWDLESLEAYEERIFTYTLKARLTIIGNLSLPAVKAKFENANGNERTVSSERAMIGGRH